MESMAVIEE